MSSKSLLNPSATVLLLGTGVASLVLLPLAVGWWVSLLLFAGWGASVWIAPTPTKQRAATAAAPVQPRPTQQAANSGEESLPYWLDEQAQESVRIPAAMRKAKGNFLTAMRSQAPSLASTLAGESEEDMLARQSFERAQAQADA